MGFGAVAEGAEAEGAAGAAGAGGAAGAEGGAGAGGGRFRDYPFRLGIASGDPTPGGCVLWTRLAPEPLAADGGMTERLNVPAAMLHPVGPDVSDDNAALAEPLAVGLHAVHWHRDEGHDVLLEGLAGHGLPLGEAGAA